MRDLMIFIIHMIMLMLAGYAAFTLTGSVVVGVVTPIIYELLCFIMFGDEELEG